LADGEAKDLLLRQMLMRSLKTNNRHRRSTASGFSLLEMITVMAIAVVVAVVSILGLIPVMNAQHVINGYNITLSALRQARDNAASQSTSYSVTFSNSVTPNTIVVAPTLTGSSKFQGDQSSVTYSLPTDVTFQTNSAISSTTAPDTSAGASFGSGTAAIDFGYTASGNSGGSTAYTIYFCPDGSAQTSSTCAGGNYWDDGVVYMARAVGTDLLSSRAITLWGGTGRIHGWRLYSKSGGGYQWLRQ
jgi:prepilin-type N-terminal cleavage/methylation domain-containing protein